MRVTQPACSNTAKAGALGNAYTGLFCNPDFAHSTAFIMGVAGFVLLIVCVNISGLLIARGVSREKEFAIRRALGAGTWRLVRQLMVENSFSG